MTLSTAANRTFAFVPALLSVSFFCSERCLPGRCLGRDFDWRSGALCRSLRDVKGLEYWHAR